MKFFNYLIFYIFLIFSNSFATEFTICSYNCGGLSDHYDYLRAASMQKLMQERYTKEPENMSLNEKIQKVALKILFSKDSEEKLLARNEWEQKKYQSIFEYLTSTPTNNKSSNKIWNKKVNELITSYKIRPIVIHDEEINQMLNEHLQDLTKNIKATRPLLLQEARAIMAKRIFTHHLKYDIICLQEADYIDASMFAKHYKVLFSKTSHSKNGIAWNKERFKLIEKVGNILNRAFAVKLLDKKSGKKLLIASAHLTGCNPYYVEKTSEANTFDSKKGDDEIKTIIQLFDNHNADLMLIGMDSNVTSLHPRLNILKNNDYQIDYENYLEPTCTNPYQVLNTRIDWIVLKANNLLTSITNIPVLSVGLNNIQTNISDHKPIAAKIKY
jgi:endonuclease/exonuclease/phosphatase family metal-dependent hydrolase